MALLQGILIKKSCCPFFILALIPLLGLATYIVVVLDKGGGYE